LKSSIHGGNNLVKKPLTDEQLLDWKEYIEKLVKAFISGHVEVDPRDYHDTCKHCGLQTLCRVREQESFSSASEESECEEAANG
jgi:ATP-dependent helicase/DNAse subunit B